MEESTYSATLFQISGLQSVAPIMAGRQGNLRGVASQLPESHGLEITALYQ